MRDEGIGRGWWKNLLVCPKETSFESQNGEEMILIMARRHLATNIGWILVGMMLSFVPLFWGEFPIIALVNSGVKFGIVSLWYLGLALFAFQKMLLWFYNIYIVTDIWIFPALFSHSKQAYWQPKGGNIQLIVMAGQELAI